MIPAARHAWPEIEARALAVELLVFDFDGVFTDNHVYVDRDGRESVCCSRADGFGISAVRELEVAMLVISTETDQVVSTRCAKLKLEVLQACSDKLTTLRDQLAARGISPDAAAYVGNDINDVEVMGLVGLPIAVADAYEPALRAAMVVSERPGGKGAVREICDWLVALRTGHLRGRIQ